MKNLNKTEQRMLNQIKRAKEEGRGMYTLPMKTQNFYNKYISLKITEKKSKFKKVGESAGFDMRGLK